MISLICMTALQMMPMLLFEKHYLPDMDGYRVERALKSMPKPPVIVFLSVDSEMEAEQRGFEAGGDAFVAEERGWEALLAQIRAALAARARGKEQGE